MSIKISLQLSGLIELINRFIDEKHPIVKSICRPKTLLSALNSLNSMIGMDTVKDSLCSQVISFIVANVSRDISETPLTQKFKGDMLHFCCSGPPGVGKSHTARIVAKILYSLGSDQIMGKDPVSNIISNDNESLCHEVMSHLDTAMSRMNSLVSSLQSVTNDDNCNSMGNIISKTKDINESLIRAHSSVASSYSRHEPPNFGESEQYKRVTRIASSPLKSRSACSPRRTKNSASSIVDDPNVLESEYLVIAGRQDLVAPYMGQTASLCEAFLEKHKGKIILFEEFYSMYSGDRDSFGMEALTVISRAMDEKAYQHIFGFIGYKEVMMLSVFKAQPGILRRITYFYETSGYDFTQLSNIFRKQISSLNFLVSTQIEEFFKENAKHFDAFGGDTMKLCKCVEDNYCLTSFENLANCELLPPMVLTKVSLQQSFAKYLSFKVKINRESNDSYLSMYM